MNNLIAAARQAKHRWRLWREAWLAERWVKAAAQIGRDGPPTRRALVLVSGGVGSIGDEAMVLGARAAAAARGIAHATLVSYGHDQAWDRLPGYDRVLDLGNRFSGDFWSTCPDWLEALRDASHFLIIGADIMDGHYSPYECRRRVVMARMAAAAGVRTVVLGFSFNERPNPLAVSALGELPAGVRLCARDPISLQRLQAVLTRPVALTADIAFMLTPAEGSPLLGVMRPWLAAERSAGRLLIGLNANFLAATEALRQQGGRRLAAAYAAGMTAYAGAAPNASFLLIPHDYRSVVGLPNDQDVAEAILNELPSSLREHTRVVPRPARADEIKAIAADLDVVMTGRMHLAIAAIGCGVPAGGVVYQNKFEGLYRHLGLQPLCLEPSRLDDPEAFAAFLLDLAGQRGAISAQIAQVLPRIRQLSLANLDEVAPLNAEAPAI